MPWTTFWTGVANGCEYLFGIVDRTDITENKPATLKTVYDAATTPVNPYTEGIMEISESTDDIDKEILIRQ